MGRMSGPTAAIGGSWAKLNPPLSPWILDVIHDMGFTNMTPVQAGTIPRAIKNQDCVVEAVTGSGKTLAYLVPVLERLCRSEKKYGKGEVAAIVIAPTRELASQIYDILHHFLSSLIPKPAEPSSPIASSSRSPSPAPSAEEPASAPYSLPCLITSGTVNPHDTFLSLSSNILIGTPGRLASFLLSPRGEGVVRVGDLDCLVLDEADKLLSSPDHRRDVERIMRYLPKQRRTHLFSATMTDAVEEMVGLGLRNPVRIVVNLKDKRTGEEAKERRTPMALQNTYLVCRHAEKTLQLVRLLQHEAQQHEAAKFIVYFSTCAAVDYFYRILAGLPALKDFALTSLHGDLPPRVRATALSSFTSHPSTYLTPAVLLCTDVASRGVDFADVDVVIQYDPPTDPKTFSHRAGRTARAGRKGKAVILLGQGREEEYVDFLGARKIPVMPQGRIGRDLLEASLGTGSSGSLRVDEEALTLKADIRTRLSSDRDLNDRAAKAFVSALRAYTKHEASFIFRVADVDFADWATAYGLLRLPAMPEVKDWRKRVMARKEADVKRAEAGEAVQAGDDLEWRDAEVDWDNFAYTDKKREAARLEALETKRAAAAARATTSDPLATSPSSTHDKKRKIKAELRSAWSEQKDKKAKREEARMKRDKKKQAIWESRMGEEELGMVEKFKREQAIASGQQVRGKKDVKKEDREEWDKEYKALKREVKGEKGEKGGQRKGKAVAEGGMFGDLD